MQSLNVMKMSELFQILVKLKLILIKHHKPNQINCAVGEIYSQLLLNIYNDWASTVRHLYTVQLHRLLNYYVTCIIIGPR